jgi:chromosome partitioning protein
MGKRVLAIDLDPQGNLSFSLGIDTFEVATYTIYNVLKGEVDLYDVIRQTETCSVVCSNIMLAGLDIELNTARAGREQILKDNLVFLSADYDYIIIDTPPALSILTLNAYTASDWIVVPMVPEILSLQGVSQLKETIFAVKKYYNNSLEVRGVVLNKYNPRLILTKEVEELSSIVAEQMGTEVFNTKISQSVNIAEAPAHAKAIIQYAPKSKSAEEFIALTYEILGLEQPRKEKLKLGRGRPRKFPRIF